MTDPTRATEHCAHPSYRLPCLVPHCARWRGHRKGHPIKPGTRFICGPHWRATDSLHRRALSRARRRTKDALSWGTQADGFVTFQTPARRLEYRQAVAAEVRLWRRLRREAIERAAGL